MKYSHPTLQSRPRPRLPTFPLDEPILGLIFQGGIHPLGLYLYLDSSPFLILLPTFPFWLPVLTNYSHCAHCGLWIYGSWVKKCTKSRHQQWLCVCMCAHAKVFVSQLHLYDQVSKRRNRNNWRSGNCRKRWHHVLLDDQKECNEPWSVQTSPREEKFVSLAWSQSSRQVQCYQTPSLYHS